MQYGSSGYSGNHYRLYTASITSRKTRNPPLPDILWKASGVTTRPTSGLRLTVKHVPSHTVAGLQATPLLSQQRPCLSRSEPSRRSIHCADNTQRRHSLRDTHLLSRPQQTSTVTAKIPAAAPPKANRTMLPPLPSPTLELPHVTEDIPSTSDSQDTSSLGEDDEIYSDSDCGDNPPSRPGFESDIEQSALTLDIPFVPLSNSSTTVFQATLLQDHIQLDMERYMAAVLPSGLSPRVNNIVRTFAIHGPLDHSLLQKALNSVANLHPILVARFQRDNGRLYMQIPSGTNISVSLDKPIVSHENSETLITNARRKPFHIPLRTDLVTSSTDSEYEQEKTLSIVSLASNNSDDGGNRKNRIILPSLAKKSVTFSQTTTTKQQSVDMRMVDIRDQADGLNGCSMEEEVLMRARLVEERINDSILVLSFPRIICDFWSSCLFIQQLVDAYNKLERSSGHRLSLTSRRIQSKRREIGNRPATHHGLGRKDMCGVKQQTVGVGQCSNDRYVPAIRAQLKFQQVALREGQLLKFVPREKLWSFWESMLTAVIKRQRGPNRVKVVPPVRIPSGLGDKMVRVVRPQTSRLLRPLTGRVRPQTGREMTASRDSLTGPRTEFHFLKFEEEVCSTLRMSFPEESQVKEEDMLCLVSMAAYVLLLGRCCRGWGGEEQRGKEEKIEQRQMPRNISSHDPLQNQTQYSPRIVIPVMSAEPHRTRRSTITDGRLDLGSFLLGIEVSLRHTHSETTQGLFGPLTNNVGIRVNLSSCQTFVDLVLALGKSLQSVRNHHHFPFTTVTDELGVSPGLPIRLSYLYHSDTLQLSNPAHFYFPETAVGVKGHGLARLGSKCYLSPLCSKLDDSCHLELCLWEGYDNDCVGGVFLFQPHVIRRSLVELLANELMKLMATVAKNPRVHLSQVTSHISPFSRSRTHRTNIHTQ